MKKKYIVLGAAALLCAVLLVTGIILAQGDLEELTGFRQAAYAILNRTKLENTVFTGTVSEDVWDPAEEYCLENTVILQKVPDKDFVIMNLTDLHMTDFDYYGTYNLRIKESIRTMVEQHQPDLITISGDIFCTDSTIWSVMQLTELLDSLQIPWAPVFGNHDDGGNCDLNYLADVMMKSAYCLMKKGDPSMGVGNYILNICEGDKVVHSMIMMDTHTDGLWENQIGWYRWAAAGVEAPSTVIMHIPIIQYQYAYDAAWDGDGWRDGFDAFGDAKEAICPEPGEDTGFFAAVKEVGLTTNILCGHDHTNDFSILYEGVRLSYGMRLGVYGSHSVDNMGATLVTVDKSGSVQVTHVDRFDGK